MEIDEEKAGVTYVYTLDAEDRIKEYNLAFVEFAKANSADKLPVLALNQPIWDFIDGPETRHLIKTIITRARKGTKKLAFNFRCDSPTKRRYMQLTCTPLDDNDVRMSCRTLKVEQRDYVSLLDRTIKHSEEYLRMCSWCNRIEVEDKGWMEVEDAVNELKLFDDTKPPYLTHTICKKCSTLEGA